LLGKGACHMFLESSHQGLRVFQKHMTQPPFMVTKIFWLPHKRVTKFVLITIGLTTKILQLPQDWWLKSIFYLHL
jgi:hypothetical protein